jgi:RNA polymerase sigma-70 factor (ECF subfamily)
MQQTTTAAPPTFEAIYTEYNATLVRYTLSKIRGISEDDAADIVADVWVKIYRMLPSWEDQGLSVGAWLFTSMRNAIIDYLRATAGKSPVRLDPIMHDPVDETAESDVLDVLSTEIMEGIIAALDPRQAEVIRLVYVEQWRLTDVAEHFGETLDAMKKLHRRALVRVRTFLETGTTRRKRSTHTA